MTLTSDARLWRRTPVWDLTMDGPPVPSPEEDRPGDNVELNEEARNPAFGIPLLLMRNGRKNRNKKTYAEAFWQFLQIPPTSSRTTRISKPLCFDISFFNLSKEELVYSMMAPQRKQAMWEWSRLVLAS